MYELRSEAELARKLTDEDALTPREQELLWRALCARRSTRPFARGRSWRLAFSLAAMAAGVAGVISISVWLATHEAPERDLRILSGQRCVVLSPSSLVVRAECAERPELSFGRARVRVAGGGRLSFTRDRVRVQQGSVSFAVEPAPAPFVVEVSDGEILVVGTRFLVEQGPRGGSVRVEEGVVRFLWSNTQPPVTLAAGQSLGWPEAAPRLPDAPATPEVSAAATPHHTGMKAASVKDPGPTAVPRPAREPEEVATRVRSPVSPTHPDAIMRRLFQLRSQGAYDRAIELLRAACDDPTLAPAQRARLSVELGVLLAQHRGRQAACDHWRAHLRLYPDSPQRALVRDKLQSCGEP